MFGFRGALSGAPCGVLWDAHTGVVDSDCAQWKLCEFKLNNWTLEEIDSNKLIVEETNSILRRLTVIGRAAFYM